MVEKTDQLPFLLAGGNSKLKERLRALSPELYTALERSWTIAWNEWLPAMGINYDSYNSYPHLKSLEYYLDEVILGFEPLADQSRVFITPTEIYIILCAILFHDIGHITNSESGSTHAKNSKETILKNWNYLGICSFELAKCIAKICEIHDCYANKWDDLFNKLYNVVIDPYGEIRERWLGAILILIDHMDGAFTRVLPRYIHNGRTLKIVGAFREVIRGVYVDPVNKMVRTVIGEDFDLKPDEKTKKEEKKYSICVYQINLGKNNRYLKDTRKRYRRGSSKKSFKKFREEEINQKFESFTINYFNNCNKNFQLYEKYNEKDQNNSKFSPTDWLVLSQVIYVELVDSEAGWPPNKLLAMIVGDVFENYQALSKVKSTLAVNGIFINAWVIDYKEHLFNIKGQETFEPIYSAHYLGQVAKSMWKLSSSILNPGFFSYETLASDMRDPQIDCIKAAVRRIGIIYQKENFIWAGEGSWKWVPPKNEKATKQDINSICDNLTKLPSPILENNSGEGGVE